MTDSGAAGIGLWLALAFPSTFVVQKYLGSEFTIAYAIVTAAIVSFRPHSADWLSHRNVRWLSLLTLVVVVAAFAFVYPLANTHAAGAGSDDDDALDVATRALILGRFPYAARTYLGNAVHHLPGSFLLASPFVLLGASALQNLFWVPLFFLAIREEHDEVAALSLAWLILGISPVVMHEIVTGTGYLSNTISVVLGLWWLLKTRHRDVAAIAWGVALTSRANFMLLLPLAFAGLRRQADPRAAARAIALAGLTIVCLTLPFYLHDPRDFAPLEGAGRLLVFDQLRPHLGTALMAAAAALALGLSLTAIDPATVFRNCALVQAFPVAAGVLLTTIRDGHVNFTYARYGTFFAWFAFMACVGSHRAEPRPGARVVSRTATHGGPAIGR